MKLKLSSNFSEKPVSVVIPIEKVVEVFWPKDKKPPFRLPYQRFWARTVPMQNSLSAKKPKSPIPASGLLPITLKAVATVLGSASNCRTTPTIS